MSIFFIINTSFSLFYYVMSWDFLLKHTSHYWQNHCFGLVSQSVRCGHASNGVFWHWYNEILFLQVVSWGSISPMLQYLLRRFWWNGYSYDKGSLARDKPSVEGWPWQAAFALLVPASLSSTSWRGLCQRPDWAPVWLGTHTHPPGDCSSSLQIRGPNSTTSCTLGCNDHLYLCRENGRPHTLMGHLHGLIQTL